MAQTTRTGPKEDLRQRRTRSLLVKALLELLEEQSFQSISVVDICNRAMVHRTTFYTHFEDKQALLNYTIQSLLQKFQFYAPDTGELSSHDFFLSVAHRALVFLDLHRKLLRPAFSGDDGVEFHAMELHAMEDILADGLCQRLQEPSFRAESPDLDPQITAHFYAGAMVGLIHWWLEQDAPIPEETIIHHLDRFLPGVPAGNEKRG